jgi:hypothetical protein
MPRAVLIRPASSGTGSGRLAAGRAFTLAGRKGHYTFKVARPGTHAALAFRTARANRITT